MLYSPLDKRRHPCPSSYALMHQLTQSLNVRNDATTLLQIITPLGFCSHGLQDRPLMGITKYCSQILGIRPSSATA